MTTLMAVADTWVACVYLALGLVGAVGLLALLSPRRFATLATRGTAAVDASYPASVANRLIGLGVLGAVLAIGYWIARS